MQNGLRIRGDGKLEVIFLNQSILYSLIGKLDEKINHVEIVEKVEDNRIYTIEGNSNGDMCRQKEYKINNKVIVGYGTPAY